MPVKSFFPSSEDAVFIRALEVSCRVGDTPEERAFPQILSVDVSVFLPLAAAGRSDRLADTIDYALLIERIRQAAAVRTFVLVEAVAEAIADIGLADPKALAVEIRVAKKAFPGVAEVGVSVRRQKTS